MPHSLHPGHSHPLGATVVSEGVNFCVFSKNCTAMELLLFDDIDGVRPARVIYLDPARNRTFYYWHVLVPDLRPGQLYGYRAYGPYAPELGYRYDGTKVLVDPYARAIAVGRNYDRDAARGTGDNAAHCMKSVVVDHRAYDWEGDECLHLPFAKSMIYEMHVGGFTRAESSGVAPHRRGTFAGVIDKVPYLQDLGITAVELLPIKHHDEEISPGRRDYWGYNPVNFFAPHAGYSSSRSPLGPVNEFRDMVKALHRAGIEVILDMVFNHTAEGDETGPTFSNRGLENRAYYIMDPNDHGRYANYTGCGNTVNGNHSIVRRMILDCLHYWVQVMHVDGFRFDLASVLARDESGAPLKNPPVLWEIESDPVLAGCKIIAEAWDAAGLYQVGSFVGHRWAEWNGQYRDDVRRFIKGDRDTVAKLKSRLMGSPDVYPHPERDPHRSINFITCHDGFTLNDLVSFNDKHNLANGENNRDGADANWSWNCGAEGPTDDPAIQALRLRQMKNLFVTLLMSHGTPMFLMGDEVGRTQQGNNNAYCQDNELSWFDWRGLEQHEELLRFVRMMLRFRRKHGPFRWEHFWPEAHEELGTPEIIWHGVQPGEPDVGRDSHSLAFELRSADRADILYVILNAYWEALSFELPPAPAGRRWRRVVDTSLPTPNDINEGEIVSEPAYEAGSRSAVILVGDRESL